LARSGQQEKGQAVIAEARRKLPSDTAPLALASCYEALRQFEPAESQYRAALAASPDSAHVLRRVAAFYLSKGRVEPATELLERMLEGKIAIEEDDLAWGRRNLALVLAGRSDQASRRRALALLEKNLLATPDSLADLRAKAIVLANQPGRASRREAIQLLERAVAAGREPSPEEQYILARLYLAESQHLEETGGGIGGRGGPLLAKSQSPHAGASRRPRG
jgi:tetratricopeptide (TPR) repeat protein